LRKLTYITAAAILLISTVTAVFGTQMLGDESDGSKTEHPHLMNLIAISDEMAGQTQEVGPNDDPMLPFSTRYTCGECHTYEYVQKGWHFNYTDPNVTPGRPGHPWLLVDSKTGTQIPVSYRDWPGAYKPEQLGMTAQDFIKYFGRQIPGGGAGEIENEANPMRQMVSGKLEINCLACHNANSGQDMMEVFGWAQQIAAENFRWAAASSSEFCSVTGAAAKQGDFYDPFVEDAIKTTYRPGTFDESGRVHFDVGGKPLNSRCYFCHSTTNIAQENKWAEDADVHLTSGLACVDCHREGNTHQTIRGYEGELNAAEPNLAKATTCQGCHIPDKGADIPYVGRLGAPVPAHKGIPEIHFERLTCTACHSGLYPKGEVQRVKTSIGHGLGLLTLDLSDEMLPHIQTPIYAAGSDGKIAPYKMVWPSFWAAMTDANVVALKLEVVKSAITSVVAGEAKYSGDWPAFTDEQITKALAALAPTAGGKPGYVTGGKLLTLDESGNLVRRDHPAAKPYSWAVAHNVRPAAQSLGAKSCEECHSKDAPFFFSKVAVDTPVQTLAADTLAMYKLQEVERPLTDIYVNKFFKWLIIIVMTLLIMHIMGDLFRRVMNRIFRSAR
jgi:hypothetical protein